jgi:competence protein ComEA
MWPRNVQSNLSQFIRGRLFQERLVPSLLLLFLALSLAFSANAKKKPPAKPVNINIATSEELQLVPGIGPATADKILQMRKSYGAFKSVDDLLAIRGLGPKRLEKMRKYLTVGKPAAAKPAALPAKTAPPAEKLPDKP